jgi:hypothetical protein
MVNYYTQYIAECEGKEKKVHKNGKLHSITNYIIHCWVRKKRKEKKNIELKHFTHRMSKALPLRILAQILPYL